MAGPTNRTLMPHTLGGGKKKPKRDMVKRMQTLAPVIVATLVVGSSLFSLPTILSLDVRSQEAGSQSSSPFPVSVNPANKTIVENPNADALINGAANPALSAAVADAGTVLTSIADFIASLPVYQSLAGTDERFVTIDPGFRQEQVAAAFGSALSWSSTQKAAFLKQIHTAPPTLSEGEFTPGTYEVSGAASATDVQNLLADRFNTDVLSRYSTSTAEVVPLSDALTVASLIERETGGTDDMRMISGIIWNRLFVGMNLQIDATLQYAKADTTKSWWPAVHPADKYIKSAYNTYQHAGLPPTPIASPSIAAVIAALNPKPTDCIFYFHDKNGNFHCSATYAQHVALLKKYYGQGK